MRIASLLPSATEIVCALGLEESLVAVTHECDYPPSVRNKPVVTRSVLSGNGSSAEIDRHIRELVHRGSSIYGLDAERLDRLHPDLILTQELCEVCAVSYPLVEQAARRRPDGPQLVSLEPESLDDVLEHIRLVGRLTSRDVEAGQLVAGLRRRLEAIAVPIRGRPARRVVTLEWVAPPFNCGHWTPELVRLAGGHDPLGTPRRPAHRVAWEEVAAAAPEVVVVSACGFSLERSLAEVGPVTGQLHRLGAQIWVVDGNAFFSRPGPRLIDSVEIMAGILHPEMMAPPAPTSARRLAQP
jgi:iron complex transport system substrate-binding protein